MKSHDTRVSLIAGSVLEGNGEQIKVRALLGGLSPNIYEVVLRIDLLT